MVALDVSINRLACLSSGYISLLVINSAEVISLVMFLTSYCAGLEGG